MAGICQIPSCSVEGEEALFVPPSLRQCAVGAHLGRDLVPASHRIATVVGQVEEGDGGTASKAAGFRPGGGTEERGADTAALVAFSRTGRVVTPTAAASDGEAGLLTKPGPGGVCPPPRRQRDDTGLGVRTTVRQEDAIQVGGDGREVGSPNRRGTNNVAIATDEVGRAVAVVFFFFEGDSEITRTALLLDDKDRRMGGRMIGDGRGARRIEGWGRWKDSGDGDLRLCHVDVC